MAPYMNPDQDFEYEPYYPTSGGQGHGGGMARSMSRSMSRTRSHSRSRRQSMAHGYPGSYQDMPPHGGAEYQQPYQIYGPPSDINVGSVIPMPRRITGGAYDDPFYDQTPPPSGHGPVPLSLSIPSALSHSRSHSHPHTPRRRRHSSVSFLDAPPTVLGSSSAMAVTGNGMSLPMDPYRRTSGTTIKFKRKGAFAAGIGLDEAQSHGIHLSGKDSYGFLDLHADSRRRVYLKVKWVGYASMTYEIPVDAYGHHGHGYDGRVNLNSLARRVSRACVHYLQANVIPMLWNRVLLHRLEEVSYGVWQPMLSTR